MMTWTECGQKCIQYARDNAPGAAAAKAAPKAAPKAALGIAELACVSLQELDVFLSAKEARNIQGWFGGHWQAAAPAADGPSAPATPAPAASTLLTAEQCRLLPDFLLAPAFSPPTYPDFLSGTDAAELGAGASAPAPGREPHGATPLPRALDVEVAGAAFWDYDGMEAEADKLSVPNPSQHFGLADLPLPRGLWA